MINITMPKDKSIPTVAEQMMQMAMKNGNVKAVTLALMLSEFEHNKENESCNILI